MDLTAEHASDAALAFRTGYVTGRVVLAQHDSSLDHVANIKLTCMDVEHMRSE